ncbi:MULTISPECIES: hypothetical protein [Paraburkholderia]|uniref:Uncharacterized protein n=1 Tax=Paraburkholderia madseniana TaxID=2599607 RepID=A0A6N6W6A8_9BURK|nr:MULTISPECIES: hypothetical protein [Paraburkholderia]KAE8755943.1 hypothetical protein FSO04_31685 [Paraburkholderia madseniana]MCX4177671.1 hypothetical protein [Paraburkholderia madseniana]MDQ6465660.1 hypothetical protein [Paraburkholderia madseniana]
MKTGMSSRTRGSSAGHGSLRLRQFHIRLIVAALIAVPCGIYAFGISVDGGTAIKISTAANGHQTVNIAPTVVGVSNNTYNGPVIAATNIDLQNAQTVTNSGTIKAANSFATLTSTTRKAHRSQLSMPQQKYSVRIL